jgi:hypothetical protein
MKLLGMRPRQDRCAQCAVCPLLACSVGGTATAGSDSSFSCIIGATLVRANGGMQEATVTGALKRAVIGPGRV